MDHDRASGGKRLRLTGARFNGGRLPIDSLVELQKYQEVVRIAARIEWRREHPGEELPSDLNESVSLAIERIDEGSADVFMGFEQHAIYAQYQVEAQDAVDSIIEAAYTDPSSPPAQSNLIDNTDLELLEAVSQLGSTLSVEQGIEVYTASETAPPVKITIETRKHAIENLFPIENFLLSQDPMPKTGSLQSVDDSLVGRVTVLDADDERFTLVIADGSKIHGWYRQNPALLEDFRKLVNSTEMGPLTRISGTLQYKAGKPFRFKDASLIERVEFDETAWGARLTQFAGLRPGWDDGEGDTISFVALEAAQLLLRAAGRAEIEWPGVFPNPDGGVLIEWANSDRVRSVEILADGSFEMFSLQRATRVSEHSETRDLTRAIVFIGAEKA